MPKINSILLVEDDHTSRYIAKRNLGKIGTYIVDEAHDGEQALAYIAANGYPDLILLDINMPVMNGLELLKELAALSDDDQCCIAMLTSSLNPNDKEIAFSYRKVVAYIEKPITESKFREVLGELEASICKRKQT